ncbi:ABC transporter substrate-binding protein [Arcanobacterium haemolyticum]|nr:ABC transporter substrate-binding protein [Arcanobacterium haemolyticum]
MRRLGIVGMAAAIALTLTACGNDSSSTTGSSAAPAQGYDTSSIQKVDSVASLVPESVKADGKLTVGTNIYFAPAEFYAEDGKTAIGYDVDLSNALAKVMGLDLSFENAEFAAILPGIPSKYEIGIANFSVNEEREANFNMIPYFSTGSSWAVPADSDFDPANICGKTIGVQTGTVQDEESASLIESCNGDLKVQRYDAQTAITTAIVGGKLDATYTDTSVAEYTVAQTNGKLKVAGEAKDVVPIGIVAAKDDEAMTEATKAALQYLMDEGILDEIFAAWGITSNVATEATVNPAL